MRATLVGLLRSRVGVAIVLAAIVLGAVGIARLFGDNRATGPSTSGYSAPSEEPLYSGSTAPDDGVVSAIPTVSPSVASGAASPAQVASAFAASWLQRTRTAKTWLDALRPHSTQQLVDQLQGVDPQDVPDTRITGTVTLVTYSESAAQAVIPLDSGRLVLRMVGPNGHWFVDGVDWERA
ncbi:MAG: hypothetical protein HOV67_17060 [Kribbellaceae bacterium]|nr:hypothetical protein [Kribbellaceae bacterium]